MDSPALKDISLRCNTCKKHYALSTVLDHQKHHRAMRILRFKEGKGPKNVESLTKRHLLILQKVLNKFKDQPSDPNLGRRIEKINDAYEILRFEFTKDNIYLKSMLIQEGITSMRDGYFEPRDKIEGDFVSCESVLSYKESGYPFCVAGVGLSQALNKEWRDIIESRTTVTAEIAALHTSKKMSGGTCYIGLFDGNHGSGAAQCSKENLHKILSKEISSSKVQTKDIVDSGSAADTLFMSEDCDIFSENQPLSDLQVSKCLSNAYRKMDEYLGYGIRENSKLRWSGCSALTCLIMNKDQDELDQSVDNRNLGSEYGRSSNSGSETVTGKRMCHGKLFVANAGDAQAVLYHKKKPFMLSEKHTLDSTKERRRVLEANGEITGSERHARIYGVHKTTRGLGNHGDPDLRKCVSCIPHVSMAKITKDSQMLVMATSSLWEVFTPQDVLTILMHTHSHSLGLRSGPTPVIPIRHDRFHGGRSDSSDGFQNNAGKSSTLPSIMETEEEEIEEVIFVEGQPEDSDSDEDIQDALRDGADKSSSSTKTGTAVTHATDSSAMSGTTEMTRLQKEDHMVVTHEQKMKQKHANLAKEMSEQLVRAAVAAGVMDNVSVIVILFTGALS